MRVEAVSPATHAVEASSFSESEFEAFYRRAARPLWAYLQRMMGDAAAADDLSQKAFIQLLRTPLLSHDEAALRGLLYRTATNMAIDEIRRRKREREGWLGFFGSAPREDAVEIRHDVGRAFGKLKPKERALLWLAHVEGFDHRELAQVVGVEPGSVRVLLVRARKRLGAELSAMGLGPEVLP
ncbi:MAG TPA: sigma-70 family RNA polymerase sigma factor [Thermoanaerobaculia bacterium]|nr:sigma-70 family RNA polymerase sigma factor [Thermoanaerobaculia bacterium]